MHELFAPFMMSDMLLSNRIVMAPMTRNRAAPEGVPSPLMAIHYGQRGDAGLVISESAPVSAGGWISRNARDLHGGTGAGMAEGH